MSTGERFASDMFKKNELARDMLIETDQLLSRCRRLLNQARNLSAEAAKLAAGLHLECARCSQIPQYEVYCDDDGRQYILNDGQRVFGVWVPEVAA